MPKKARSRRSPVPILLAGGLLLAAVAIGVVVLGMIVLLAYAGVFQSQSQLFPAIENQSVCGGQLVYSVQLAGPDGRGIAGGLVSTYVDGVSLENLTTDQNGRFSSTRDISPAWCGKLINLSLVYSGDVLHKGVSASTSAPVQIPTEIEISTPPQTENGTGISINATLTDSVHGTPLEGKALTISNSISYQATTDAQGRAQADVVFNETGIQTIKARFSGDEFYLPSESEIRSISVVPRSCADSTVVGHCSPSQTSYFCNDQEQLVFDCSRCGCGQGLVCGNDSCITQEQEAEQLVAQLQKSVVYVDVPEVDSGSGVVIDQRDDQTVILTNYHVINGSAGITNVLITTADQKTASASDIRVAPNGVDLAVIYVRGTYGEPAAINYTENESQGASVIAIGSPLGIQNTVTQGIISNFLEDPTTSIGYIQTDAAINHGNSGGGLFLASDGSLIGINSMGYTGTAPGISFAIDITELQALPPYQSWPEFTPAPRCTDGTPYNTCSSTLAGNYCSEGNLYPSCQTCGCSSAYPFCNTVDGSCFSCNLGSIGYVDNNGQDYCCPKADSAWVDSDGSGFCCPSTEKGYVGKICQ